MLLHRVGTPRKVSPVDPEDAALRILPGDVLAGKFQVERLLGQGGMGQVVSAMHLQLRERVALKFLLPSAARNEEHRARFLREAQAAAKIRSDHVARVIDVGTLPSDLPYIVMEHLEGEDLQSILQQRGRLPVGEAIELMLQAMEGVAEAHAQGIIHRDLKPANLFVSLTRSGDRIVKVLDFGISKIVEAGDVSPELTQTSSAIGSPMYMSPEQIRSARNVDTRTDVWALGVILYQVLTGKFLWKAENSAALCAMIAADDPTPMRVHRPELPEALDDIVLRALAKRLEDRIQNVADFASALSRFAPNEDNRDASERIARTLTGSRRSRVRPPASNASVPVLIADPRETVPITIPADSIPVKGRQSVPPRATRASLPWVVALSLVALGIASAITFRLVEPRLAEPVDAAAPPPRSAALPPASNAPPPAPPSPARADEARSTPVEAASVVRPTAPASASAPPLVSARPVMRARPPAPNPFADRE